MNVKTLILSAALLAAPALAAAPSAALAQAAGTPSAGNSSSGNSSAGTTKVAVVDPGRVIDALKETQAMRAKVQGEIATLDDQQKQKQQEVTDLQARRDQLNPDSAQYDQVNRDLLSKSIEFQAWTALNKADLERRQKQQIKTLYDKVEKAIGEVAKQQGIDLVLVRRTPVMPDSIDKVSLDQLKGILNAKEVLFASDAADLSGTVIAKLDQQYQAGGGR